MIVIVGAGISGLALAHDLAARGLEHVVLEKEARAGGVIRSARSNDGHLLEWGPQRTRLVGGMRQLIADAGLQDNVIIAPPDLPLLVYRDNKLRVVPVSLGSLFNTDLISWPGKLRILAEPLTAAALPDESAAQYFIRKVGREAYANMLGPLYGGLYASDPAEMEVELSLAHTLCDAGVERSLLMRALNRKGGAPPPACSFTDGMQMLPEALARLHASTVLLGCAVHDIERLDSPGLRYVVHHTNGELKAHSVVITGNAPDAARLVRRTSAETADRIAALRYNRLAIVHLHTSEWVQRALGYQVSFDEKFATRGVTFNAAMFARTGIYTAYLGGAKRRDVIEWDDAKIAEVAVEEFALVTGASARVVSVARTAMPAWDWSWRSLERVRAPDGFYFCTNWESRPGLPGRLARARALGQKLANGLGLPA